MLYISVKDHARKDHAKIQQLCSSAIYKQNVSISLRLSDSGRCRRGYYFLAWVLYFSFGTYYDVNIKHLCSSRVHKHNSKYGHAWVI